MDKQKQKQIEELMKDMCADYPCNRICDQYCGMYDYAERAINAGYRKIPENAVVLETSVYESLEIKNYRDVIYEQSRKETAEKFAERLKEKLDISVIGYSTSEVISEIEDKIDEICKEITNSINVNNRRSNYVI